MNFLATIALLCLAPATKYYNLPRTQLEVHSCQVQYIQCVLEKNKKGQIFNLRSSFTQMCNGD